METENIETNKYEIIKCDNWEDYGFKRYAENTIFVINFEIIVKQNLNYDLSFKNCIFEYKIEIENIDDPNLGISFLNCKFKNSININNNNIKEINLIWYSSFEKYCHLNSYFESEMSVSSNKFALFCKIQGLNQTQSGSFSFIGNIFNCQPREINPKRETNYEICKIENCHLFNGSFNNNTFYMPFAFKNNVLKYNAEYSGHSFVNNLFQKSYFSYTDFGKVADFSNCNFYGTTLFENCKNLENSELKFIACKFEKYSLFDNSKFNKIEILHSKFLEKASFKNFETNDFKIYQVTFGEVAYFDDLNKENENVIEYWDRETLRAIKRELINTHNQIDYLRFKAYELNAYKKEINQNKLNWKDSLILYFNKDSNYFGLDWTKGIQFIIKWGFLFYFLYLLVYILQAKNKCLIPKQEDFYINYLKFLNPFSFLKSPIDDAENYFLPFLFFVLGKIFVSYGIYQTVQAFRKFGVNGG